MVAFQTINRLRIKDDPLRDYVTLVGLDLEAGKRKEINDFKYYVQLVLHQISFLFMAKNFSDKC